MKRIDICRNVSLCGNLFALRCKNEKRRKSKKNKNKKKKLLKLSPACLLNRFKRREPLFLWPSSSVSLSMCLTSSAFINHILQTNYLSASLFLSHSLLIMQMSRYCLSPIVKEGAINLTRHSETPETFDGHTHARAITSDAEFLIAN